MTLPPTDKQFYVCYHKGCADGLTGLYMFLTKYGDNVIPVPTIPGKLPIYTLDGQKCDFTNKYIAFVDVVPFNNPKELEEFTKDKKHILILDHHKTNDWIIKSPIPKNVNHLFDMNRCGARITHYVLEIEDPILSTIIKYVDARDRWQYFEDAKEISKALYSMMLKGKDTETIQNFPQVIQFFKDNEDNALDILKEKGTQLFEEENKIMMKICENAEVIKFKDHSGWHIELTDPSTYMLRSDIGSLLCNRNFSDGSKPSFSVTSRFNKEEGIYFCSARGTKDSPDLTVLFANLPASGGHPQAFGFSTEPGKKITDYFE